MLQNVSATPCPVPVSVQQTQRHRQSRDSLLTTDDDATANVEFTSAFGGSLRNTRPRRRYTAFGKNNNAPGFAIHEDVELGPGGGGGRKTALAQPARRAVISHAAQAPNAGDHSTLKAQGHNHPSFKLPFASKDESQIRYTPRVPNVSRRLSEVPRRPNTRTERPLVSLPEETSLMLTSTTVLKPARRGTIYIPNDDTTMPSMYMGIFSPIKDLDARMVSGTAEPETEITGIAAQMAKKRNTRRSMIATSPKRAPLHVSRKNVQGSATVEDRYGQGGGKENIPPGHGVAEDEKSAGSTLTKSEPFDHNPVRNRVQHSDNGAKKPSKLYEATASSMGRTTDKTSLQRSRVKPTWNSGGPRVRPSHLVPVKRTPPKSGPSTEHQEEIRLRRPPVPTRFIVPGVKTDLIADDYPILTEDLATPSMYEDSWLKHQEISMTQLVNNLFGASSSWSSPVEDSMLRVRLLEKYGDAELAMLYKRLQAALLFGALSVPTDILKGAGRLNNDIGRRKAFTDLWLETYNLSCLQSALEVVVGRQCRVFLARQSSGNSATREALQRFIETFLIRNEDGIPDQIGTDRNSWSYQRTLLRSLMLIKLLDITKTTASQMTRGCLFQSSSCYKDSVGVVRALLQLLNPSAGEPIRALSHIGYTVTHSQYPLEEYDYQIGNLAVDLRDGVRLTRLVELLLYPSASQSLEYSEDPNATTTVLLPTGELLSLTGEQPDWPLSQHLKFPCIGRATKLYNVQIALSALQGVRGMTALVQDVQAADIVDGYREKTVKLLWGLTSKWGLGGLVDWDDVEREIKRLCRTAGTKQNDFFDVLHDEEGPARYQILLKSWAQAVASKHGLVVTNLTTSFADTKVFEAIVEEYERYIISDAEATRGRALSERLRGLGCSEQFTGLFSGPHASHNRGHFFDRDFVLAALAFLCSRLLQPTKGPRAAVTIQRAWRQHWERVVDSRKCRSKMLAEGCAEVVRQRRPIQLVQTNDDGRDTEVRKKPEDEQVKLAPDATQQQSQWEADEEDIWLDL
ncbi:hypothetical protein A1O3_06373 [Capronia epimyces CBS 606.96]|uniref:Calponin-homology (CH) domain-containing protein n=1 Tax=Capronia epimyces CBS 606.96 TaxID=1182542 RepID=W9XYV7_9EURO|nr:uncharacterized protein A1O3_06373 [Capronia epimyces CBS 606.96]EXJ82560.1 hypothetical protein A1O3_06373 [Capronia epimyces CBS 606.96]